MLYDRMLQRIAVLLTAALLFWSASPAALHAEVDIDAYGEEVRSLLEKSLSIAEIDREIGRIAERRNEARSRIAGLTDSIADAEAELEVRREQAGRVLRAYYTGERDVLLAALLSFDSLPDLFAMMDYYEAIMSHDKFTLDRYRNQLDDWKQERTALLKEETELAAIERALRQQRERVVKLQSEVDGMLEASGDEERLRLLIGELLAYWENTGLREVERYFRAIAGAMAELPAWLGKRSDLLTSEGLTYTLRLPDHALNAFLREQNELFDNFAFTFDEGVIRAHGRRDGIEVVIEGRYTIEDEPAHAIRFHTEQLIFNGLALPDTTQRELERKFDLSFYPQLLVPFVRAAEATVDDGMLTVVLKIDLTQRKERKSD